MPIKVYGAVDAKDPTVKKDYGFDWTPWLEGDTLNGSEWTVNEGTVILTNDSNDDQKTQVWVEGGVNKERAVITNRISTAGGRTDERSMLIPIQDM
jgi:hypothetical protein